MIEQPLLSYYLDHSFNPVPINLDDQESRASHFAKRHNLYERHLGIPLHLLKGRSVLEFGCNSGENSLVLAASGANVTLVEPNELMLPLVRQLFARCGLTDRIIDLVGVVMDQFESPTTYDLVLAEGFLHTLPNRSEMFSRACSFLQRGGVGVVSFNDQHGYLVEATRRLVFRRALQLECVEDVHCESSLLIAQRLFLDDFSQLNASRPFPAWWKDNLVNPVTNSSTLWSFQEVVALIQESGCEFLSSSPRWATIDHFAWYKDVRCSADRHETLLENWRRNFLFFLTGKPVFDAGYQVPSDNVISEIAALVSRALDFTQHDDVNGQPLRFSQEISDFLCSVGLQHITQLNNELKLLYEAIGSAGFRELLETYHRSVYLRECWGMPYQYVSFVKQQ